MQHFKKRLCCFFACCCAQTLPLHNLKALSHLLIYFYTCHSIHLHAHQCSSFWSDSKEHIPLYAVFSPSNKNECATVATVYQQLCTYSDYICYGGAAGALGTKFSGEERVEELWNFLQGFFKSLQWWREPCVSRVRWCTLQWRCKWQLWLAKSF